MIFIFIFCNSSKNTNQHYLINNNNTFCPSISVLKPPCFITIHLVLSLFPNHPSWLQVSTVQPYFCYKPLQASQLSCEKLPRYAKLSQHWSICTEFPDFFPKETEHLPSLQLYLNPNHTYFLLKEFEFRVDMRFLFILANSQQHLKRIACQ